jgi:two-component system cell cycle sensor histidine kinase/response regulator CckA
MESIGKLAGGIAHEFNSLLTAILGQCEMLLPIFPPAVRHRENATEINQSGRRADAAAAGLWPQAISQAGPAGSQPGHGKYEGRHRVPHGRRGGPPDHSCRALGVVRADAGQIEQVILNLVINAREAMPSGGKLTLETGERDTGSNRCQSPNGF